MEGQVGVSSLGLVMVGQTIRQDAVRGTHHLQSTCSRTFLHRRRQQVAHIRLMSHAQIMVQRSWVESHGEALQEKPSAFRDAGLIQLGVVLVMD